MSFLIHYAVLNLPFWQVSCWFGHILSLVKQETRLGEVYILTSSALRAAGESIVYSN